MVLGGLLGLTLGACSESNPEAEQAAYEATGPWLALMDAGEYGKCWEEAAPWFHETVKTRETWLAKADQTRSPLGALVSRVRRTTTFVTNPMGAPDGEYTIVVFDSRWEQGSILETVSMQKQGDGTWRVVGYHVKEQ